MAVEGGLTGQLGSLQVLVCGALLTLVGVLFGFCGPVSFIGGAGSVLVIGFGRVGQIVTQSALLRGAEITIIGNDTSTVRDLVLHNMAEAQGKAQAAPAQQAGA